jgi:hypothetical protein
MLKVRFHYILILPFYVNSISRSEVTPEITVYRYSPEKLLAYIQKKVSRLNSPALFETSKALVRTLARDGLMEDGKEQLLEGVFDINSHIGILLS